MVQLKLCSLRQVYMWLTWLYRHCAFLGLHFEISVLQKKTRHRTITVTSPVSFLLSHYHHSCLCLKPNNSTHLNHETLQIKKNEWIPKKDRKYYDKTEIGKKKKLPVTGKRKIEKKILKLCEKLENDLIKGINSRIWSFFKFCFISLQTSSLWNWFHKQNWNHIEWKAVI